MKVTEVLNISLQSIKGNKLRTMLTVLGVVVGIFSIIVIMTVITMLQDSIQNGFSQLGQNTFQIQKFPAFFTGGPSAFAKFRNRKTLHWMIITDLKVCLNKLSILAVNSGNLVWLLSSGIKKLILIYR
ncbi:MAG: ABC transporter permease [Ignavibacteriaceae bacterium]